MIKITKIVYRDSNNVDKALSECDVIIDDVLKLTGIRLYKKSEYFLIFPNKQDFATDTLNECGYEGKPPKCLSLERKKSREEFYYPVDVSFYALIRDTVAEGYEAIRGTSTNTYIPS